MCWGGGGDREGERVLGELNKERDTEREPFRVSKRNLQYCCYFKCSNKGRNAVTPFRPAGSCAVVNENKMLKLHKSECYHPHPPPPTPNPCGHPAVQCSYYVCHRKRCSHCAWSATSYVFVPRPVRTHFREMPMSRFR